jgi:uncharacterized protein YndB with AHSA1/START domain
MPITSSDVAWKRSDDIVERCAMAEGIYRRPHPRPLPTYQLAESHIDLHSTMTVTHSVLIAAPQEIVWRVTEDVERWPEWTPSVSAVTRKDRDSLAPGSRVMIKQPGQPESEWVVTELVAGQRFSWETRRAGLHMVATHELIPAGEGTRNVLTVHTRGFLAMLLWPILRIAIPRALALENGGLKKRCEEVGAGVPIGDVV